MILYLILFTFSALGSGIFFRILKKVQKKKKREALQRNVTLLSNALYQEILNIDPSLSPNSTPSSQELQKYYQEIKERKGTLPLHKLHFAYNQLQRALYALK